MEELLNKLIKKGWKPFGRNYCKYENGCLFYTVHTKDGVWSEGRYGVSLRELTSKESGLWQFCVENGIVKKNTMYYSYGNTRTRKEFFYKYDDVVFWILESSMTNEDSLEQFLLDNIKIEG